MANVAYSDGGCASRVRERGVHVPQRRCIACGRRAPQAEVVRFVLDRSARPGRVVVDRSSVRTGRGAYLCPRRVCLDQALRRRAFQRAFRQSVVWDAGEILEAFEDRIDEAT